MVVGKNTRDRLVTSVDCFSGYGMIDLVLAVTTVKMHTILTFQFHWVAKEKRHTYTHDNGSELGKEDTDLESKIGMGIFRVYPYHSCERGTNENYNGLMRDFFPKGMDFATLPSSTIILVSVLAI